MTARPGLFVQQLADDTGTSAKDARLAFDGSKSRNTAGDAEVGVLVDGMGPVVTGTGAMSYSVRSCVVRSKHSTANGTTDSANDSAVTVTTTAAPGTNSRIDAIYAVQRLDTTDGGNTANDNAFVVGVVQGAVSGSPSAPLDSALPQGAVRLANVTVTTSATSTAGLTFTATHAWVASNGGVVPTAKGSRLGRVWDGTQPATVPLGVIGSGPNDAVAAASFMQVGTVTATTGAFGDIKFNFPQAFPTAMFGMVTTEAFGLGGGAGAPYVVKFRPDDSSRTQGSVRIYQANTGAFVVTSSFTFTFIAWGH